MFRMRYDILDYVIGRTYIVSMLKYSYVIVSRLVAVMLLLMRSTAENGVIHIFLTLYDILGIK